MSEKLQLDQPADGVARLTISNPERRGALDHEILDALAEHARTLDARCLVIRGSGDVFSAGYDIGNLSEQEFEESAEKLVAHPFHDALEALEAYRYPVIAEVNGHAIGGGLELALTADIRVAARGVKMGMPPAKLGLIYSHTGLAKFIDVCGPANTAELFFVGRNVEADRALEMGLVNEVVEHGALDARVLDLAERDRLERADLARGQQADDPRAAPAAAPGGPGAGARGAARVLLRLRGLPRGRAGLHGEAEAGVARALAVSDDAHVLPDAVDLLRCPVCSDGLTLDDAVLRCDAGHSFDVARQGYVNLVPGNGDSAEMVEAREAFLGAGHFRPLTGALVAEAMNVEAAGAVVDVGAGTGHHLAYVLATPPERPGSRSTRRPPPSAAPPASIRAPPPSEPTPGSRFRSATGSRRSC